MTISSESYRERRTVYLKILQVSLLLSFLCFLIFLMCLAWFFPQYVDDIPTKDYFHVLLGTVVIVWPLLSWSWLRYASRTFDATEAPPPTHDRVIPVYVEGEIVEYIGVNDE